MPGLLQKQDRFGGWNPKTLGMLLVRTSVLPFFADAKVKVCQMAFVTINKDFPLSQIVLTQKHIFSFVFKTTIEGKVVAVSIFDKVSILERPISCVNKNGLSYSKIPKFHLISGVEIKYTMKAYFCHMLFQTTTLSRLFYLF